MTYRVKIYESAIGKCGGRKKWDAAMKAATNILVRYAKQGAVELLKYPASGGGAGLITYGVLADKINRKVKVENREFWANDSKFHWLLGAISEESRSDQDRGFMLSALVVRAANPNMGIPGVGFFRLARGVKESDFPADLRYEIPDGCERFFWHRQCEKIFAYYGAEKKAKRK